MNQPNPQGPGHEPGPSWLSRFYDNSGLYLAVWCRLWSLVWSVWTAVSLITLPFWPSWHLALSALFAAAVLALHIWLGFFYLANPEWKDGDPDGDA